jgi:hypothetical protein
MHINRKMNFADMRLREFLLQTYRSTELKAAIQRRDSILAWIVILSVYGADTIAEVMLLISPFLR